MLKTGHIYRLTFLGIAARVIDAPPGEAPPKFPFLVETLFLRSRYYVNERGEPADADAPRIVGPFPTWLPIWAVVFIILTAWFPFARWLQNAPPVPPPGTVAQLTFIYKLTGFAYISPISSLDRAADEEPDGQSSPLMLYENDKPLGPAHSAQLDTMNIGKGRFSHWKGRGFIFAASDNSDPTKNGRNYWVVDPTLRSCGPISATSVQATATVCPLVVAQFRAMTLLFSCCSSARED